MASLKRKRLNSSSDERATNIVESLSTNGNSRVQVGNSYTEVHNYDGRHADDECLRDLRTTDPRIDKTRIEKDKGGLLQGSYSWVLDNSEYRQWAQGTKDRLLWVKGDPGKGKTMLLCGLIDELTRESQYTLSYFFCQATDSRTNNPTSVLRGLVYLLVLQETTLTRHVRSKWDHGGKSAFDPPNGWYSLCNIFEDILHGHSKPTSLIIDALDECEGSSLPLLLNLIVTTASKFPHIKWLVSSRNLPNIERGLGGANPSGRLDLTLEANAGPVSRAVAYYIDDKVDKVARLKSETDLRSRVKEMMQNKANGTFLWAALAFKQLESEEDEELEENSEILDLLNQVPEGLTNLYDRMWRQINSLGPRNSHSCKTILATVFLAFRPLQLQELPALTGFKGNLTEHDTLMRLVRRCGSFLTTQQDTDTLHFVHQSAKDFLTNNADAFGVLFPSGMGDVHHRLFSRSLGAMTAPTTGLRQNMYGLPHPGVLTTEILVPLSDPLLVIRYSCSHWLDHFYRWISSKQHRDQKDSQEVAAFLQGWYLYWLEALGLSETLTEGIISTRKLEDLAMRNEWKDLTTLVRDAHRFALANRRVIEMAPLQVYVSALIFSPTSSWVRKKFEMMIPKWIKQKPTMQPEWDACLLTLEGHKDPVCHLTFAPDNKIIVSSDGEGIIKIWDPYTGACLNTISSYHKLISGLTFLPGESGTNLASVGQRLHDFSVQIRDPFNGPPRQKAHALRDNNIFLAFMADGKTMVSTDGGRTLMKWDLDTGSVLNAINLFDRPLAVSPNGQTIITITENKVGLKVSDWCNPLTPTFVRCRQYREDCKLAFSSDSTKVVGAFQDPAEVQVWDLARGRCSASWPLVSPNSAPSCLALSPDGAVAALGDGDGTISLWDTTTGTLRLLGGHSDRVHALAISPHGRLLASGSKDKTIKIWDPTKSSALETFADTNEEIKRLVMSPNGLWIGSCSSLGVTIIWNSATSKCIFKPTSKYLGLEFSPDSRWVALGGDGGTIEVWDTATWKLQFKFQVRSGFSSLAIVCTTALGMRLALTRSMFDRTTEIWDPDTGQLESTFSATFAISDTSIKFSPNGLWLSLATEFVVEVWDWAAMKRIWIGSRHSLRNNGGHVSWHPAHDALLYTGFGQIRVQGSKGNYSVKQVHLQDPKDNRQVQVTPDGEWITVLGKRVLWLPPQYRPRMADRLSGYLCHPTMVVASNSSRIAIASSYNQIIVFQFESLEMDFGLG